MPRYSEEQKQEAIRLYESGMSVNGVASLIGCTNVSCYNWFRVNDVQLRSSVPKIHNDTPPRINQSPHTKAYWDKQKQRGIEMYQDGMPAREIASILDCHRTTCYHWLRRNNIELQADPRSVPHDVQVAMVDTYNAGLAAEHVAAQFGYASVTCLKYIHQFGHDARTVLDYERGRLYYLNEQYFDEIDTEEKAYWLGFISADGWIHRKVLGIGLAARDVDHLVKFLDYIDSEHPIYLVENRLRGKVHPKAQVEIGSRYLVRRLNELGIERNKSHTISPCIYIPEKLLVDYWRGCFDGDGGIMKRIPKQRHKLEWTCCYSGNENMVGAFAEFIQKHVYTKASVHKRHSRADEIAYGGIYIVQDILELLYGTSTVYLDRKYELYKECMKILPSRKRRGSI